MLKVISLLLVSCIIIVLLINFILDQTHKLYIKKDTVKYPFSKGDLKLLKHNCKIKPIDKNGIIFYTYNQWSTKNNDYLKVKERYFIVEPGYYYYITPETEVFVNSDVNVLNDFKRVVFL